MPEEVWRNGDSMVYECELLYPANGTVYVYGINLISARNSDGDNTFYLYNAHGDVVQLVDGTGTITKTYNYDAFGVEYDVGEDDENYFRYAGQYFDTETGTYYLRARYYKPNNGIFAQQDTNWYINVNNPLSINSHTYCNNNPVLFADRSGHFPWWIFKFSTISESDESKATPEIKMLFFALLYTTAALSIGTVSETSNNISSRASRFSINSGLKENDAREGSQRNAFRHSLWIASIAREFGEDVAKLAGWSHEVNSDILEGIDEDNYSSIVFNTLSEADEAIDIANNMIGIDIGLSGESLDMRDISREVLDYFYNIMSPYFKTQN